MEKSRQPRGLRNNNPLNIRRTRTTWAGQLTGAKATDAQFCQFEAPEWGWRAAFKLLHHYYYDLHLMSVDTIIRRWAPSSDGNNTEAYIKRVCQLMNWPRNVDIGLRSVEQARWMQLAAAMAIVENGTEALDYFAMMRGFEMSETASTAWCYERLKKCDVDD